MGHLHRLLHIKTLIHATGWQNFRFVTVFDLLQRCLVHRFQLLHVRVSQGLLPGSKAWSCFETSWQSIALVKMLVFASPAHLAGPPASIIHNGSSHWSRRSNSVRSSFLSHRRRLAP